MSRDDAGQAWRHGPLGEMNRWEAWTAGKTWAHMGARLSRRDNRLDRQAPDGYHESRFVGRRSTPHALGQGGQNNVGSAPVLDGRSPYRFTDYEGAAWNGFAAAPGEKRLFVSLSNWLVTPKPRPRL